MIAETVTIEQTVIQLTLTVEEAWRLETCMSVALGHFSKPENGGTLGGPNPGVGLFARDLWQALRDELAAKVPI